MAEKHIFDDETGEWREAHPRVYTTPALPLHYVADGNDGTRYLFPAVPAGWGFRVPYVGNYDLARVPPARARAIAADARARFDLRRYDRVWIADD